jgi:hypothetical protein
MPYSLYIIFVTDLTWQTCLTCITFDIKQDNITGFVTRLTRRVSLLEQELLTLLKQLSSSPQITQRSTKHTYKTKDQVTRTPLETGDELSCFRRVSSSCSSSDTRRVNLVTNPVIIIYNSNKHFHSSFTHTLLPFCFSKIFDCSWHSVLNLKSWKKNLITYIFNYFTNHNICCLFDSYSDEILFSAF